MAEPFFQLSRDDRRDVLAIAAEKAGRPIHLLEKDAWVVWALQTLYRTALGDHLVFKGGTSLSKAYNAIRRFSEDVDLTYDIRALAHDLVGENQEALPETRSEEKRWSSEVRKRLPVWACRTHVLGKGNGNPRLLSAGSASRRALFAPLARYRSP